MAAHCSWLPEGRWTVKGYIPTRIDHTPKLRAKINAFSSKLRLLDISVTVAGKVNQYTQLCLAQCPALTVPSTQQVFNTFVERSLP